MSVFCITTKDTEKIITIDIDKRNIEILQDHEWTELCESIKNASKREYSSNESKIPKRIMASEEVLNYIDKCLSILRNKPLHCDTEALTVLTEILRFLRNCTSDLETQQYISERTNILKTIDSVFSKIIEIDINSICLKVLLQFLINLMPSNKEAGEKIFVLFYERVKKCLQLNINVYESSALIYYISLIRILNDVDLTNIILDLYRTNLENEFLTFFLENSIIKDYFWSEYQNLKIENRIIVIEILKNMHLQNKLCNFPVTGVEVLAEEFLKSAGSIFHLTEKEEGRLKAYEVHLLLEMLSSLSSDENYLGKLQSNTNILINAGVLLINIHKLGRENNNCFTPIANLSEFKVNSGLNEHPAFGFKADLVRLIGNLCWKNTDMQNLARTAELIPVILDSCNMDARNPFIIQWSILALRNLCENNVENQKIIAGLHQEGTVSSEVLNEMGLTLHNEGESELKIIALECLKKN